MHHVRKANGEEVTADHARGASAFHDAVRSLRTINPMAGDEALKARVTERRRFFRIERGKANMLKPAEAAEWVELVDVALGNARAGLAGDQIGVATGWEWPNDPEAGLPPDARRKAQDALRDGHWRKDSRSPQWPATP